MNGFHIITGILEPGGTVIVKEDMNRENGQRDAMLLNWKAEKVPGVQEASALGAGKAHQT